MSLEIKKYEDKYFDDVIALIEKSDHTNRERESWGPNHMSAVLAFDNDNLVGVIPFERFDVPFGNNIYKKAAWVSAAHIEPELRGSGIGTKLDDSITEFFKNSLDLILVVRKDEGTKAFKWYKKIGYSVISKIESLKIDTFIPSNTMEFDVISDVENLQEVERELLETFEKIHKEKIGYPRRHETFWSNKFNFHYYKKSYEYFILRTKNSGFALLGRTSQGDSVDRLDILEFSAHRSNEDIKYLIDSILCFANEIGTAEVRIQFLESDNYKESFLKYGFTKRWETNLMGKMIDTKISLPEGNWQFFHSDYI